VLIVIALSCNVINAYANNCPVDYSIRSNESTFTLISELSDGTLFHEYSSDSISRISGDTVNSDTSIIDSLKEIIKNPKKNGSAFKSKVTYHGDDSIMIDNRNNKAYMWGNAWVKYETIELQADYLEIDFEKNEVFAKGLPDSTGKLVNTPVFIEQGKEYKSGEMTYNFRSKKGLIKKITTQEASGYIHGEKVKMASRDVFYIKNGRYTTCELDHPHYYIQSKKLKIINNDKIITGPAYMAIEDVPTFLATPFGFFPNQDQRTSGILVPAIGSSQTKGFSLSNGGYYFGFSDQFDLKFLGDIYSNGSWSGKAIANYKSRYKRNGALQVSYTNNKVGERDTPEYTISTAFFINWRHTQDPKAKPNSNFTAMVNMGSSDYFQNDLNTSSSNFLRNEFTSNITYTQKFRQSPFTASINASHNQNNQDSIINFVLPEINVNMARIYPLKRKNKIGRDKWYEKVGVTYSGGFKNELSTKITNIFPDGQNDPENPGKTPSELINDFNNGARHKVNTSTSLKLGHLNISPGIAYSETWYFKSFTQQFDTSLNEITKDTTSGFNRFGNLNLNTSVSTKLYGMFAFRGEHLKAIRHTMTPSVSFSYQPNLSDLHPEYFGETVTDTLGTTKRYTVFDGSVYGTPNGREMGVVSFQLQNIVEMKHKKRNDTTDKFTNVNLIDAWNFNTSYNMLADSFNWAPLRMDIRARVGKFVNLNVGTTSDFYGTKTDSETEVVSRSTNFYFNQTGKPLRLIQLRTSLGFTLSGESLGTTSKQDDEINKLNDIQDENTIYQESQYVNFNVPWDLKVNYVLTYNKPFEEVTVVNSLNFSGSINLTPGWKVQMRSSYDFDLNKLGYTTMNVYRDLHCWQIDLSLTPFGSRKSFMLNIKVKQGFLQDLKLSRNSRWFDG
jgi:hypothetical protein